MPQDAFSLFAAAEELDSALKKAKINKITQPNKDEINMLVYTLSGSKTLTVSANAESCRVCFTRAEKSAPKVAPNFCMLLRKHLLGAVIESVKLVGYERIIAVTFACKNDFRENVVKVLYCEIMGKYSNLILTENGIILGCLKNAPLDVATTRLTLSGAKYTLPKPQDKADILCKEETVSRLSAFSGEDKEKFLFENVKGLSYATAAEAALKISPLKTPEEAYEKLAKFLLSPPLKPNIAGEGKLRDFYVADYVTVSGEKEFYPTVSEAADAFYSAKENKKAFDTKKKKLSDAVNGQIKKLNKKLQGEEEKIAEAEKLEVLKVKGDLILANLWRIKQGDKECVLENYYDDMKPVKISLDVNLSPSKNAQKYYKKYAKDKRALEILVPEREKTKNALTYLSSVIYELSEAKEITDFDDVETELISAGLLPPIKQKKKEIKESPFALYEYKGYKIKRGKNNLQNDRLTSRAFQGDTWLHTKGYHSSHVIVETKGEEIPKEVILVAAEICAYYSDAKEGNKIPVDYALKKFVKKPNGAKPGSVIYTDYKTCIVNPAPHEELKI